jgi:phage terminase small subunit
VHTPPANTPADTCAAPVDLSESERAVWETYASELAAAGRLNPGVCGALTNYCCARATIDRLRRAISEATHHDVSEAGTKSPLLPELRQWVNTARLLESDLLLSPAAVSRAPAEPAPEPDPFAEFDNLPIPRPRPLKQGGVT